jgi:hypothetical protein
MVQKSANISLEHNTTVISLDNQEAISAIVFCKISSIQSPDAAINDSKYRKRLALVVRKMVTRQSKVSGAFFSPADDILVRATHEGEKSSPAYAKLNATSTKNRLDCVDILFRTKLKLTLEVRLQPASLPGTWKKGRLLHSAQPMILNLKRHVTRSS